MIQSLLYYGFKWLNNKEVNDFNFDDTSENSLTGYILECDLVYSKEFHDNHNDCPLCPVKNRSQF